MEGNYITRCEHDEFAKRLMEEDKRQNARIELLEKAIENNKTLVLSVEKLAINMDSMYKELHRQGERLDTLEKKPIKSINTFASAILSTLGGAIGTAIVGLVVYGILMTQLGG